MNIFNNEEQKKERFQKRFLVLNEQLGDVDFFFLCVLTGNQATKCGFAPVTPDPNPDFMQPLLVGQLLQVPSADDQKMFLLPTNPVLSGEPDVDLGSSRRF